MLVSHQQYLLNLCLSAQFPYLMYGNRPFPFDFRSMLWLLALIVCASIEIVAQWLLATLADIHLETAIHSFYDGAMLRGRHIILWLSSVAKLIFHL